MHKLAEILLSPKRARRHPIEIMLLGAFYTTISLFLSFWVFPEFSSIAMVFLTVIACLYLTQGMIIREESLEESPHPESWLLRSHGKILMTFFLLFMGFVIAYTALMIFLPTSVSSVVFSIQEDTFNEIRAITGRVISPDNFFVILTNNLRVLMLSLIFALFYGAGAIFILAWNASLIGFVIESTVKHVTGLLSLPQIFTRYFLHGIPEIVAYLAAALAGSILFITIVRGEFKGTQLKRTILDVTVIITLAVALLILAAALETFVSPLI